MVKSVIIPDNTSKGYPVSNKLTTSKFKDPKP